MSRQSSAWCLRAALLVLAGTACGGSAEPIQFNSAPASTTESTSVATTVPVATTAVAATAGGPPTQPVPTRAPVTASWVPAMANLADLPMECGDMAFVWSRPGRDMLVASIAHHGLFASIDGSEEWTPLGTGAGSAKIENRATGFVQDPDDPATFWEAGIYFGPGIFKTSDDGATFQALGDITHTDLVSVDLTDPDRATMLAGVHETSNLFRSTDAGATWTQLSSLPPDIGIVEHPRVLDAQTHLLGTHDGPESGVFRTTDGGATWTRVYDNDVSGEVLRASDGSLYWIVRFGGGMIRSTDEGATWTEVGGAGDIHSYATSLVELPDGRLVTIGSSGHLVASSDQGASWASIGPELPYEPNGVTYSPSRKAFYIWRYDCNRDGATPTMADAIMRLDFDHAVN